MSGKGTLLDVLFDAAQEAPEQVIVRLNNSQQRTLHLRVVRGTR